MSCYLLVFEGFLLVDLTHLTNNEYLLALDRRLLVDHQTTRLN
jgi:hypothetical protein